MNRPLLWGLIGALFWLASSPSRAQVYYVDLAAQPLNLPASAFAVEQVLDGRPNRAGIGTVHRGLNNIPQVAGLHPTVAAALTAYLQAQLPPGTADKPRLVLVIRQLQLAEEITALYEKASLELALDAYVHLPDGYHYALSASDFIEGKGMETTARHAPNLALALRHCLAQCQGINWAKSAEQPARSLAYLEQTGRLAEGTPVYPILVDSVRKKGYFPTFLAFRNNQPEVRPALLVEAVPRKAKGWEGTSEVKPYFATASGGKEYLRNAWGFSDGRQLYIFHHRHFVPLEKKNGTFGFVGFSGADPGAVSTGALVGGAIGGAIAAGATNDQPTPYTVNMVTGDISLFDDPGLVATPDTALLCIYRRAGTAGPPVQVLLNGKPLGELADNQFLTIPWTDKLHEPRLCLAGTPETCFGFLPEFGKTNYLRISRTPADASKPPLEQVTAKGGEFEIRQLKARAKSRGK
ncbi:hypothetical protein [Hymenobacter rubidus]|uniref:hypothetical protein n=1 Tax=Hymenobacter rubidus TaxID=1441626 RepID=UPI00191DA56F|nr:hypothetical protein [Hymenobacter rubidus]